MAVPNGAVTDAQRTALSSQVHVWSEKIRELYRESKDAGTFKFPLSYDGESPTVVLSERELEPMFSGIDIDLPTRH